MAWFEIRGQEIWSADYIPSGMGGNHYLFGRKLGGRWCLDYTFKLMFNLTKEEWETKCCNLKTDKDFYDLCEWLGIRYKYNGNIYHNGKIVEELDRLKKSFNNIILFISYKSIFDITNEEFMFLERMIKNQTIISNSRLKDWGPNGELADYFKLHSHGDFENGRLKMIKYDEDIKECMKQLSKILNIEFEDLKM